MIVCRVGVCCCRGGWMGARGAGEPPVVSLWMEGNWCECDLQCSATRQGGAQACSGMPGDRVGCAGVAKGGYGWGLGDRDGEGLIVAACCNASRDRPHPNHAMLPCPFVAPHTRSPREPQHGVPRHEGPNPMEPSPIQPTKPPASSPPQLFFLLHAFHAPNAHIHAQPPTPQPCREEDGCPAG